MSIVLCALLALQTPLPATALAATPFGATPLPATPLPATPFGATPLPATWPPATWLPATPLPATPLPATPLPAPASSDTLRLEVGSPEVNGLVFPPHRAQNRVYIGDATTAATTWTNELTLGDSAGIRVARWVTVGTQANGSTWELRQTFNARTLAPLRWAMQSSAGADSRLVIDGMRVHGTWKTPGDTAGSGWTARCRAWASSRARRTWSRWRWDCAQALS